MRNLIAFLACSLAIASASAIHEAAPSSKSAEQRAQEQQAEAELSARIEARIAQMRARQRERAEAQARAHKQEQARRKQIARTTVVPRSTRWEYAGAFGPANWSRINVDWQACGSGKRQSPIDIRNGMQVALEHIGFDYKPTPFTVEDTGHTVEVGALEDNFITLDGERYQLEQFHFHNPSEERIDGKAFEMTVHLEHRARDGRLAVVAVLLERGQALAPMQAALDHLPLEKRERAAPAVVLNPAELLPAEQGYYTYMGSMTTPPCTENVQWVVLKKPVQASAAQMRLFARLYPMNARPVQPAAGRIIKASN